MAHLALIEAIANAMEAEGWQDRPDFERCAEAAQRYNDVMTGRTPAPWAAPVATVTPPDGAHLRADGQFEIVWR